ncbi:hypothetical protein FRC08_014218 [Ceratobasidium sp. 394]|nr:hypothetical protein FRC08_014218 [Ceratobasidium sp. 394]
MAASLGSPRSRSLAFLRTLLVLATTYTMSSYSYSSSSSSTASLMPRQQQQRDYSTAFATLASSYGSSGAAPCRASSKTASHLADPPRQSSSRRLRSLFSRWSRSRSSSQSEQYVVPKSEDFGALMNKYGASTPLGLGRSGF